MEFTNEFDECYTQSAYDAAITDARQEERAAILAPVNRMARNYGGGYREIAREIGDAIGAGKHLLVKMPSREVVEQCR